MILFGIIDARNEITKLFLAAWKTCHCVEFECVETQNAKTSTASPKRGKYLEKEIFW